MHTWNTVVSFEITTVLQYNADIVTSKILLNNNITMVTTIIQHLY